MTCVAIVVLAILGWSIVGPFIVPDPNVVDLSRRLQPPGEGGLFGTDALGRSVAAQLTYGLRTSLVVAGITVVAGLALGVLAGLTAGYRMGWTDWAIMRMVDIQMSLPILLIAAAIMISTDGGIWVLVVILTLTSWMVYARVARTLAMRARSTDFVVATESLGASPRRVLFRHLVPNVLPSMTALASLEFARILLAEAGLSFLGFGVQPPSVSVGTMIAGGREYLVSAWWITTFPGLALALVVLSFNLLGSWAERMTSAASEAGVSLTQGKV